VRRRKLLVVLAGLAVVICAAVVLALRPQPDRVTRENFDRITECLNRAEVEAILGPPGDYRTVPTDPDRLNPNVVIVSKFPWSEKDWACWQGDAGEGWVFFGKETGTVRVGVFSQSSWEDKDVLIVKVKQGPLDNLLWRAKRQWRRWFPE
jgi:hypothetical protein